MAWTNSTFEDFGPSVAMDWFSKQGSSGKSENMPEHTTTIAELSPGMFNSKIVGVIISKSEPRQFISKKDFSSERSVLSFTIRDSPDDFINVSCWGGQQFISNLVSQYHIGQVVELHHAVVQSKPLDGTDERFKPWTPRIGLNFVLASLSSSQFLHPFFVQVGCICKHGLDGCFPTAISLYHLSLNESKSSMKIYEDWNDTEYLRLLQIPVKPHNDFYTIDDILANGLSISGECISILAVVKQVGPVKSITSKTGRHLKRCEIKLFDNTASSFTFVLWDEELIRMAATWMPRENIIFAADVKASYDDYKKSMIVTAIAKSIVTVNPDTKEAHSLFQYAQTVNFTDEIDCFDSMTAGGNFDSKIDLAQIDSILTIEELKNKIQIASEEVVLCIVHAFVSMLDVDENLSSVIASRCPQCHFRAAKGSNTCSNQNCPPIPGSNQLLDHLETRVSLTDHTGTIQDCILANEPAEQMLGCSVSEMKNLSSQKLTELKWKFLLERCKVYLKVLLPTADRKKLSARILSCKLVSMEEIVGALQ